MFRKESSCPVWYQSPGGLASGSVNWPSTPRAWTAHWGARWGAGWAGEGGGGRAGASRGARPRSRGAPARCTRTPTAAPVCTPTHDWILFFTLKKKVHVIFTVCYLTVCTQYINARFFDFKNINEKFCTCYFI